MSRMGAFNGENRPAPQAVNLLLAESAEVKGDAEVMAPGVTSLRLSFPLHSLRETISAASPRGLKTQ